MNSFYTKKHLKLTVYMKPISSNADYKTKLPYNFFVLVVFNFLNFKLIFCRGIDITDSVVAEVEFQQLNR